MVKESHRYYWLWGLAFASFALIVERTNKLALHDILPSNRTEGTTCCWKEGDTELQEYEEERSIYYDKERSYAVPTVNYKMKEISKRKSNMAYSPLYSQHNTKANDEPRLKWAKIIKEDEKIDKKRRLQIKKAFLHGWEDYATHVWGADELYPISKTRKDWLGGQGTMIVDSITTMIIMGALDE
ncbi:MAG: hypothetical protein EZS28_027361, partial [Streblomastix strix]